MKIIKNTDEIYKLFKGQGYTKEIINTIKNFYFNECNAECGSTKLENICHVSSNISVQKTQKAKYNMLYEFVFSLYYNKQLLFIRRPA